MKSWFHFKHIPGAQSACVFQVSFLDDMAAIAPEKQSPIIVYGASLNSRDAETAIEKLNRAGYTCQSSWMNHFTLASVRHIHYIFIAEYNNWP